MARSKKKDEPTKRAIALGENALTLFSERDPIPFVSGFQLTPNGLVVDDEPSFEECVQAGKLLPVAERSIQFAIGDFINYLEERFGETASQIIDYENGWSEETCRVYAWLARRIAPARRRMDRLTIKHHLLVAGLSAVQQDKWLTRAAADGEPRPWPASRLRAALRDGNELPETYWLLIKADDEAQQMAIAERLTLEGLTCKALVRRSPPPAAAVAVA